MYGHTPLHEAARRLAEQLSKPLSGIFCRLCKEINRYGDNCKRSLGSQFKRSMETNRFKTGRI